MSTPSAVDGSSTARGRDEPRPRDMNTRPASTDSDRRESLARARDQSVGADAPSPASDATTRRAALAEPRAPPSINPHEDSDRITRYVVANGFHALRLLPSSRQERFYGRRVRSETPGAISSLRQTTSSGIPRWRRSSELPNALASICEWMHAMF